VICRCLDGLPLALELAAPWIKALTLDDLRRRLDRVRVSESGQPALSSP
jgi:predicted ATPase